jgi:hypothetical protein
VAAARRSPGHLAWRERNGGEKQMFGTKQQDSRTINSKEDPELFETIAKLKRGDKIRFSGRLDHHKGCVHEHSVTQSFGMEWPAFWFTYSEVNGVRSTKLSAKAAR